MVAILVVTQQVALGYVISPHAERVCVPFFKVRGNSKVNIGDYVKPVLWTQSTNTCTLLPI